MARRGKVTTLVGAQYGSEGKGVVAQALACKHKIHVRTGAPNAGHSIVHGGLLYKMQTIPCGWVNPDSFLVIGAGALLNVDLFFKELELISRAQPDIGSRIFIDANAGILENRHHQEEGGVHGTLHKEMGSTGEGVGAARRDRMARNPEKFVFAKHIPSLERFLVDSTSDFVCGAIKDGTSVLLEGTQGCGLSLIHGSWPHVTTNDTNSAQLAADIGIPPQWVTDCVLVIRTYPIRVAGPSGPLKNELTWDEMSNRVGKKICETTTVTKKQRRIGEWDENLIKKAVTINAPTGIALTFLDYFSPIDAGKTTVYELSPRSKDFIHYLERTFSAPVVFVGTGFSETEGWCYIG